MSEKEKKSQAEEVAKNSNLILTNAAAADTVQTARVKYHRDPVYNRKTYDSGSAKYQAKKNAFSSESAPKDPYTGSKLTMTKAEAKAKYGENWQKHLAEADHIVPLKAAADKYNTGKYVNPFLTENDLKEALNQQENLQVTSRKYNNAKRSDTDTELLSNEEKLKRTGLKVKDDAKETAQRQEKSASKAIRSDLTRATVKNVAKTGFDAGINSAANATISTSIISIVEIINGNKTVEEALKDVGEAAGGAFVLGGTLAIANTALSGFQNSFIQSLLDNNVPSMIVTAVIATKDTVIQYVRGEITTGECIKALGQKGVSLALVQVGAEIGSLIPIPVVGTAVGALVGYTLNLAYSKVLSDIQKEKLAHEERMRIEAECYRNIQMLNEYRMQFEKVASEYLISHIKTFNNAFESMKEALGVGDIDGFIAGTNTITRTLGKEPQFETMDEFDALMSSDTALIL